MIKLKMFLLMFLCLLNIPSAWGRDCTSAPVFDIRAVTQRSSYVLWRTTIMNNTWQWVPSTCLPGYSPDWIPICSFTGTTGHITNCTIDAINEPLSQPGAEYYVNYWTYPQYQLVMWGGGGISKKTGCPNSSAIFECVIFCHKQIP